MARRAWGAGSQQAATLKADALPEAGAERASLKMGARPKQRSARHMPTPQAAAAEPSGVAVGSSADVASTLGRIDKEVERIDKTKTDVRLFLEGLISRSSDLGGCRIEVVGSTSWGGSVPQSDLDLVLFTPSGDATGKKAIELLATLERLAQEAREQPSEVKLKDIELLDAPRVAVLRLTADGIPCDVCVDQERARHHRAVLRARLEGRPELRSFARLVKFWLRRRGFPMAAEGGIPSLAWAVAAIGLAEEQPAGTSVEALLMHFFERMSKLGERTLFVQHEPDGQAKIRWEKRRTWGVEWTLLFRVDDPTWPSVPAPQVANGGTWSPQSITPPSIPTALGLFFVAECRMAWKAVKEERWEELLRLSPSEARLPLRQVGQVPLHLLLKDGVARVGRLKEVRPCPNAPSTEQQQVLHRRDQSSVVRFENCSLTEDESGGCWSWAACTGNAGKADVFSCSPCNWVCSLPTWSRNLKSGDAPNRLQEILQVVQCQNICSVSSRGPMIMPAPPGMHFTPEGMLMFNGQAMAVQPMLVNPGGVPGQAPAAADKQQGNQQAGLRMPMVPVGFQLFTPVVMMQYPQQAMQTQEGSSRRGGGWNRQEWPQQVPNERAVGFAVATKSLADKDRVRRLNAQANGAGVAPSTSSQERKRPQTTSPQELLEEEAEAGQPRPAEVGERRTDEARSEESTSASDSEDGALRRGAAASSTSSRDASSAASSAGSSRGSGGGVGNRADIAVAARSGGKAAGRTAATTNSSAGARVGSGAAGAAAPLAVAAHLLPQRRRLGSSTSGGAPSEASAAAASEGDRELGGSAVAASGHGGSGANGGGRLPLPAGLVNAEKVAALALSPPARTAAAAPAQQPAPAAGRSDGAKADDVVKGAEDSSEGAEVAKATADVKASAATSQEGEVSPPASAPAGGTETEGRREEQACVIPAREADATGRDAAQHLAKMQVPYHLVRPVRQRPQGIYQATASGRWGLICSLNLDSPTLYEMLGGKTPGRPNLDAF
eukprot:TRINITY_DN71161_c0_g1_i1.p1 TRINITY_DN71161_c0_g1~~TRINITY_DN71161_c0_g1_i1.p1  ORF type:complete len:1045 (-),score=189.53 TRINITY_DN71161_c0_g1_i1:83-3100(-)